MYNVHDTKNNLLDGGLNVTHHKRWRLSTNMVTTKQNNEEKSPYLFVSYSRRATNMRSEQIKACVDSLTEQTVCGE